MDMDESGEEHSATGEQYEEEIVPKIITDEVFDETIQRGNSVIRDLQMSKQFLIVEDIQKILLVCQNLKQNVSDERDKVEQLKVEVSNAQARTQQAIKASRTDQETIQELKTEIGRIHKENFFINNFKFYHFSEQIWKKSDASALREEIAQEAMNVLREKLEKLQKETYNERSDVEE